MKNTYAAPAVTDRGDVVHTTLSGKPFSALSEVSLSQGTSMGSNLSFGL